MDSPLKLVLNDIDNIISDVNNIEQVKSVILQKEAISTSLEGEKEAINQANNKVKECITTSDATIDEILVKKMFQHDENLRNLITDVVVAYIRNCAEHHVGDVPENFFQVGEHNIRFKINKIMLLGHRLIAENPDNVDIFRHRCAGFLHRLTDPTVRITISQRRLLSAMFRAWESDKNVNNWDRFIAKLVIVAHLICTCIKRNGYRLKSKEWINKRIDDFVRLFLIPPYDGLFKNPEIWIHAKFEKDLNPQIMTLNIPVVSETVNDIADVERRQQALKAFEPLSSDGFMGACLPTFPKLADLVFSRLPINLEQKRDFVRKYTGITRDFEEIR